MQIYHSKEEILAARRQRRLENLEERRSKDRAYYQKTREHAIKRSQKYREANRDKCRKLCKNWYERNRTEVGRYQLWSLARRRAKDNGIEFTITRDDVVVPERCPVLNIPIKHGSELGRDHWPSIDRRDNSRGYTVDNICVVSYRANRIKNDASIDELERVLSYMKQ